jgi:adenine/guanine phosphoribosyltransferase-like PRPP-binding protein
MDSIDLRHQTPVRSGRQVKSPGQGQKATPPGKGQRARLRSGTSGDQIDSVVEHDGTHLTKVGSQEIELPLVRIAEDLAIALLITVDLGVGFTARAGAELAEELRDLDVDIVASVATMGIPLAIEVSRALELDDYLIFQKTPKIHLADAIAEPVKSITTGGDQKLLFDRARVPVAEGRRVALVDDVISTGASVRAALRLLRGVGAEPVAVGVLLTEAQAWRETLGEDARLIRSLGAIPLFRYGPDRLLTEDWEGTAGVVGAAQAARPQTSRQ